MLMPQLSDFKADFYDLVILDYLMPSLDGLQMYDMLREKTIRKGCITYSKTGISRSWKHSRCY